MAFEVQAIEGVHTYTENGRNAQAVAEDIKAFYDHAAEMGGKVIAGHVFEVRHAGPGKNPSEYLYLVAELPELRRSEGMDG